MAHNGVFVLPQPEEASVVDMRVFERDSTAADDEASITLDANQHFAVFIVATSRMAREAFCKMFLEVEPALAFFQACSVADITTPDAALTETLAVIYAGDRSSSSDWVRRELALASRAGITSAIISESDSISEVAECIRLGSRGYILADFSFAVAVGAVKIIAAGELFIPAQIIQDATPHAGASPFSGIRIPAATRKGSEQVKGWGALSWRERTVLELVCMGMPNKDIGNQLGIAASTVKIHVSSIMKKFDVTNRTHLCALLGGARISCRR
jgi:DNA-binding NarL/FixJ family response regulator